MTGPEVTVLAFCDGEHLVAHALLPGPQAGL